jgi:aryl-alcohol dehydrogenase-like predicted oxidoreductase
LESSLQRLGTDYIDIYQLDWPDRQTNYFGKLGHIHAEKEQSVPIEETLEILQDLLARGEIRYIGVSNETPWGVMQHLQLAQSRNLPRIVSMQNPYNRHITELTIAYSPRPVSVP